jgi:hypothetical protein
MITSQTFYKTREDAKTGDEFIQVSMDELVNGFDVRLMRGNLREGSSTAERRVFAKKEDADREYKKHCDTARREQFRLARLTAAGKPV